MMLTPDPITLINAGNFGKVFKYYDATKITSFGPINMPERPVI